MTKIPWGWGCSSVGVRMPPGWTCPCGDTLPKSNPTALRRPSGLLVCVACARHLYLLDHPDAEIDEL
jgi:hypothetical protein